MDSEADSSLITSSVASELTRTTKTTSQTRHGGRNAASLWSYSRTGRSKAREDISSQYYTHCTI